MFWIRIPSSVLEYPTGSPNEGLYAYPTYGPRYPGSTVNRPTTPGSQNNLGLVLIFPAADHAPALALITSNPPPSLHRLPQESSRLKV